LRVNTAFVTGGSARREREVEVVVPVITAVGNEVAVPPEVQVGELRIVYLIRERELERCAGDIPDEKRWCLAVEGVDKTLRVELIARVSDAAVLERRAALNVERSEPGMDDAFCSGNAGGEDDFLPAVGEVVIGARVESGLHRSPVWEHRIRLVG